MNISTQTSNIAEYTLKVMRTRIESSKIVIDLGRNIDMDLQTYRDQCNFIADEFVGRIAATITAAGFEHEKLRFRAPKNSWNHFLRDLAKIMPGRIATWLNSKVKYSEEVVECKDIWPHFQLPERHGSVVRTISSHQLNVDPAKLEVRRYKRPETSTITL